MKLTLQQVNEWNLDDFIHLSALYLNIHLGWQSVHGARGLLHTAGSDKCVRARGLAC